MSRAAYLFASVLLLGGLGRLAAGAPEDGGGEKAQKSGAWKLTIYKVWASDEASRKEPPKELKKFIRQLVKSTKKKNFRLDEKPIVQELRDEKPLALKLPDRYEVRWSLETLAGGKTALRQVLVNPKKEESAILLKKSPVIQELEKIRKGGEMFLLIVEFEPVKS